MTKKIIWSLFDSETAITQQLNDENYQVFSIGLPSSSAITGNFIKIDLSRKSCIKKISKLPKPDIIFASPPCETWVTVNIGNVRFYDRNYNEHNLYWQKNFKPNDYAEHHRKLRLLGQKTAYWTAKIIQHFEPEMWCIENGSSSLIFKYIYTFIGIVGFKNKTYYSAYDKFNFGIKPTVFYSNKKISLSLNKQYSEISTCDHLKGIKRGTQKSLNSYSERSAIPIQLYQHILKSYEGKCQLAIDF